MAGGSLISGRKRVTAVRLKDHDTKTKLAPVNGGLGEREEGADDGLEDGEGAQDEWEKLADKYDQFEKQVKEHLDDQQEPEIRDPPIIRAPTRMTPDQWAKHQVTHTILTKL